MSYQQPGHPRRRTEQRGPSSSAVIVVGAMLAVLAMAAVITIGRQHSRRDAAVGAAAPWVVPSLSQEPQTPIPLLSDPASPSPSPPAAATGNPRPVARHSEPDRTPSRTPAPMLPALDTRVSLLASGTKDLRLRHQEFRMRLAAVGPRSPGAVRADATFVLRRGLADGQCLSLESVNFPGWFMRHRNFAVLLQPREPSRLFAADATFCPQAVGTNGDFRLRSVNFPDRYLAADGPLVALSRVPAGSAQRFRATPGL